MSVIDAVRAWLVSRFDDGDLPWPSIGQWRRVVAAVALVEAAVCGLVGVVAAVVACATATVACAVALDAVHGRAGRRVDAALPDVLEGVARSLRSGTSLRVAMGEGAADAPPRLRDGLMAVVVAAERGVPLDEAIDRWASVTPGEGVRLAAAALALSSEVGGGGARSLDGVAATLRDRNAVRREVRALSSQARASAAVIGVAPVGFALLAASIEPRAIDFLLHTTFGTACLLVGVVLDGVGAVWMHRLAAVR